MGDLRLEKHRTATGAFLLAKGDLDNTTAWLLADACNIREGETLDIDLRELAEVDDVGIALLVDLRSRPDVTMFGASSTLRTSMDRRRKLR